MARDDDPLAPETLDLALGWMERSLDQLTDAALRHGRAIARESGAPPTPAMIHPGQQGRASAGGEGSPAAAPHEAHAGTPNEAPPLQAGPAPATSAHRAASSSSPGPATSVTPLLDSLGRDLTALAAHGDLVPIIGRDEEIGWVIEVLVRTTKRNPVLLGPAGSGKTSIVEGLAQRIAAGSVPPPLRGTRLVEIPLASLVAGTSYRGQLEERLQQLVREATRPGIVLFFDEVHLLAGAGRSEGGMGADQVIKPALARGEIAVIGATTADEWRESIEKDDALARRFTTIAIDELSKDETRPVLRSVRDALAKRRGVAATDEALDVLLDFAERRIANRCFPDKAIDLLEEAVAQAIVAGRTGVGRDDTVAATALWEQRASSTPTLDRFGRDLVALARRGALSPVVGREAEIDAVTEILLRRTKRDPLLVGPAGSGKTAIVEGLAQRIATGRVPAALKDVTIVDMPLTALGGAIEREPDRLRDLLAEARHPSVIVFFDEIHVLASPAARQLAESLKPALARGEIACIGATTGEEYQAYIEPQAALARRFSPIPVQPMDEAAVSEVLRAVRDSLAALRGIRVTDAALDALRDLATLYIPNRSFPDKGVDLVEQAVAAALVRGATEVDVPLAREAVAAALGFPLDPGPALDALDGALSSTGLLDPAARGALLGRLAVTLRGLDAAADRPDAVVLLAGPAAAGADRLAAVIAEHLFGSGAARISIDLSAMADDSAVSTLLGSAPGLVGSDRALPLHELRRAPRQVLLLAGIERCAPAIRSAIGAALGAGHFTDAMGRVIPLATAVVLLSAPDVGPLLGAAAPPPGDARPGDRARELLAGLLGSELVAACDVVAVDGSDPPAEDRESWVRTELLEPLAARFARVGLTVTFDGAFVAWLLARLAEQSGQPGAFLDAVATPALLASLPAGASGAYVVTLTGERPVLVQAGRGPGAAPSGPGEPPPVRATDPR